MNFSLCVPLVILNPDVSPLEHGISNDGNILIIQVHTGALAPAVFSHVLAGSHSLRSA
jgi:hypothetical protein